MYIANICFEKKRIGSSDWKKFGSIWYDEEKHRCSIRLSGFRHGQFMAKPFSSAVKPPFLAGDITYPTGMYKDSESKLREYLWVGWIWTDSDSRGCVYNGVLEIDPTPSWLSRINNAADPKDKMQLRSLYLTIFLDDESRQRGPKPEDYIARDTADQRAEELAEKRAEENSDDLPF